MSDPILHQMGAGAIFVFALQKLKKAQWFPYLTEHSDQINRTVSILFSAATAIGIEIVHTGNLMNGGQLVITYPSLASMMDVIIHFAAQFVIQEGVYKNIAYSPKPELKVLLAKAGE